MRYIIDNDLHIHSKISLCSGDPEQTNERILQYAKENDLKTVCLTDHFWDETVKAELTDFYRRQDFAHISEALPLPQTDRIRFLFGCETEMDKHMNIGISEKLFDKFDFIIIPTTHFHMTGFTISETAVTPTQKAELWLERLNCIFDRNLPFHKIGIAHLTCGLIDGNREKFLETLESIKTEDLKSVFRRAAEKNVGIEINSSDMKFKDEEAPIVMRIYKTAKEQGCKFYLGSDAHHPAALDAAKARFARGIDYLGLTEDDKFYI